MQPVRALVLVELGLVLESNASSDTILLNPTSKGLVHNRTSAWRILCPAAQPSPVSHTLSLHW